jgi:signal transduction histidine kinase
MRIGIKFKLVSFIASLLLLVIVFLSFLVLRGIKAYQNKETEAILLNQKDMFEQYLNERFSSSSNDSNNTSQIARGNLFNKPWLRTIPASIYDTKGNLLSGFKADGKLNENSEKAVMLQYAIKNKMAYKNVNNIVYFYSPIKYKNNTVAILELQYSVKESSEFYNSIKKMFFSIGFLALTIGIILGFFYFLSLTKDIYKMKNSVENIQKRDFKNIQKVNRNDELGELSNGIFLMSITIEKSIKDLEIERDTLSKAVNKLKEMDKQQKEFIGNVTHEFKTPITTIKAYSDVMGMYKDDLNLIGDGSEHISKECDRLTNMVDRVLSLSALEKYDFEIEKKDINLKELLQQICTRMKGKIKKNNLTLNCNFEDVIICSDEENLRHIIINLIDNAIKYNEIGGTISLSCEANENFINITVADTGIGISEESLCKIFEPFYRVESHRSRETGGTGLGLALVKKLVEKQNGTIKVSSNLNKGTVFSIEFPIKNHT